MNNSDIFISDNAEEFNPESLLEDDRAPEISVANSSNQETRLPSNTLVTLTMKAREGEDAEEFGVLGFLKSMKSQTQQLEIVCECLLSMALKLAELAVRIPEIALKKCKFTIALKKDSLTTQADWLFKSWNLDKVHIQEVIDERAKVTVSFLRTKERSI